MAMSDAATPRLTLSGVSKSYGQVQAVIDVSLAVWPGEIHAIVGENGAGKSTLMHLIAGVLVPDAGEMRFDGAPVALRSPREAQDLGIGTVFQELSLVPAVSIAENVFPNRVPTGLAGIIRWSELFRKAEELLAELGVEVDVRRPVAALETGTRQLVEIAKALSLKARLLLLDEPTSALTPNDIETLFGLLRRLRASGIGIVYISHKMDEVMAIADRVTVLRDGRRIGTWRAAETNAAELVSAMVGRKLSAPVARAAARGAERLRTEGLTVPGHFANVSLALHAGEIVGLAGLMGAGRSDVGRTLAGALPADSGMTFAGGVPIRLRSVPEAMSRGIAYLPGDRKLEGLFLDMPLADNIVSATLRGISHFGIIDRRRLAAAAETTMAKLRIRASGPRQTVSRLSGGNQQKVVLGRSLQTTPSVLIVDDPTKGVDVASKQEIHAELQRLAGAGTAILLISSDLPELLALADRILVMAAGRTVGELARAEVSEGAVMALAAELGAARQEATR